jgi:hypothetical protein
MTRIASDRPGSNAVIIGGTLIILALWIAFIWFFDPDGMISRGKRYKKMHIEKGRPGDAEHREGIHSSS